MTDLLFVVSLSAVIALAVFLGLAFVVHVLSTRKQPPICQFVRDK